MSNNGRIGEFIIAIGTNGCGKTTFLKRFLSFNQRNLIIPASRLDDAWRMFPEQPIKMIPGKTKHDTRYEFPELLKFQGNRIIQLPNPTAFKFLCDQDQGFMNGGLFIDDFKNTIPSKGNLPGHVNRLFSDRRFKMLDIYMASHSFQKVNADLFDFNPKIILFCTTRPPVAHLKDKIANYDQLVETWERINARATTPDSEHLYCPSGNKHYCELFNPSL